MEESVTCPCILSTTATVWRHHRFLVVDRIRLTSSRSAPVSTLRDKHNINCEAQHHKLWGTASVVRHTTLDVRRNISVVSGTSLVVRHNISCHEQQHPDSIYHQIMCSFANSFLHNLGLNCKQLQCVIHPTVTPNILDHYLRKPEKQDIVVGILQGTINGSTIDICSCFSVP